ncbi:GntR family transcriptional regulator [Rhodococcus sp. NPDC056960]|uniref:GntR family transcriptional regulator n=1 Tax=Rhodococcus sp. NPDC056960 TaxID=3345982 RepID=UPI003637D385
MINDRPTGPSGHSRTAGRLSVQMYVAIKTRLLRGNAPPGARLSVEELRAEFGVSKQPVMEALRLLTADGLVEILPQIGCVVTTYSPEEVEDFFHMFAAVQGAVAAVAALHCTPAALDELDIVSQQIRALAANPDQEIRNDYLRLNRDFHECIHSIAGSRMITDTSRRMWDLSDFLINTARMAQPMATSIDGRQDDHDRIRNALASRDADAAKAEMEQHVLETLDLLQGWDLTLSADPDRRGSVDRGNPCNGSLPPCRP